MVGQGRKNRRKPKKAETDPRLPRSIHQDEALEDTSKFKMAATSVPLYHPETSSSQDFQGDANPMEEFSFAAPINDDSSVYTGSIEPRESFMESGKTTENVNDAQSSIYSQIFSRKGYEWLLEVDEGDDDDDMKKPLL